MYLLLCLTAHRVARKTPSFFLIHAALLHGQCHFKFHSFPVTLNLSSLANRSYQANGIPLRDESVKSAIMHDLSKVILSYSAYPSNEQITSVYYASLRSFHALSSRAHSQDYVARSSESRTRCTITVPN